ncbi:hypothetical protein AMAG_20174 [Allomyces macrogynus ATCC 38327]|uniref:Uncharacterized protein n=1 Tax=Allomyces macrogynus (strain ATCC 38327) TaxID=578462 RepID=A0A0L0T7R5_ALLM3|nr:hypothetical protein AMAG_20174 [Allomyces macrogynus ATCC 38327]|eukprot:KNE70787.1 hypothetical protein AMAG_20174 [Allomyces macrogynus ATCC 38327]
MISRPARGPRSRQLRVCQRFYRDDFLDQDDAVWREVRPFTRVPEWATRAGVPCPRPSLSAAERATVDAWPWFSVISSDCFAAVGWGKIYHRRRRGAAVGGRCAAGRRRRGPARPGGEDLENEYGTALRGMAQIPRSSFVTHHFAPSLWRWALGFGGPRLQPRRPGKGPLSRGRSDQFEVRDGRETSTLTHQAKGSGVRTFCHARWRTRMSATLNFVHSAQYSGYGSRRPLLRTSS